jgi:glucose-1-phosphate thymidylyltransferase
MKARDEEAALTDSEASAAETGVKSLVPLESGRPFLDYCLSHLADAGCTEICVVIGPEHAAIRDRYTVVQTPRRFRIAFAIQERPLGTSDGVLSAESFAGGEEFVMVNGDNYYPVNALRSLVEVGRPATVLFTSEGLLAHSNIDPARIAAFALGEMREDGGLAALIEKPDARGLEGGGPNRLVSMNCWRLPAVIFDHCRRLSPSTRGELELPGAVLAAIASGVRFEVLTSGEGVLDLSRRSDIAAVKARLRGVVVSL